MHWRVRLALREPGHGTRVVVTSTTKLDLSLGDQLSSVLSITSVASSSGQSCSETRGKPNFPCWNDCCS